MRQGILRPPELPPEVGGVVKPGEQLFPDSRKAEIAGAGSLEDGCQPVVVRVVFEPEQLSVGQKVYHEAGSRVARRKGQASPRTQAALNY